MEEPLFTSIRAAAMIGIPVRTLTRYKAIGVIQAATDLGEGRGRGHRFTHREIAIANGARSLLKAGVPIRVVRPWAQSFRDDPEAPVDSGRLPSIDLSLR